MHELKQIEFVERFQCPGCVCGSDTECGEYRFSEEHQRCTGHVLGTMIMPIGNVALGMPKGFDRPGIEHDQKNERFRTRNTIDVRFWDFDRHPEWDHLNVPVWAMEEDGFLFVRTFAPRVNMTWIDVIEGGTLGLVPNAIDVSTFLDDID